MKEGRYKVRKEGKKEGRYPGSTGLIISLLAVFVGVTSETRRFAPTKT